MRRICLILLLALSLSGCKAEIDIKPDTIVDIPLRPTEAQTQAPTEMTAALTETPTETEPVTEMTEPAVSATQPAGNPSGSGGTSSGNKKSGQDSGGSKQPSTELPTQPPTESSTEVPTEPPTEPPTAVPTEVPTVPPVELPAEYDPFGYTPCSLDFGVAEAVNRYRQAAGLTPLTLDPRLCAIASVRAYEVTVNWDHNRPDGASGLSVLDQYGYAYTSAAENLFYGFGGADAIVDKWMDSGLHREKILAEPAAAIGVGTYVSDDGLTYVAALFVGT